MALLERSPSGRGRSCLKVSLSTRCMVVANEQCLTTSSAPRSIRLCTLIRPLYPSSPPGGTAEGGILKKEILIRLNYPRVHPWFETGFYIFTSIQPERGRKWVGDHIRSRLRVPESWQVAVGLSLSAGGRLQQRSFSTIPGRWSRQGSPNPWDWRSLMKLVVVAQWVQVPPTHVEPQVSSEPTCLPVRAVRSRVSEDAGRVIEAPKRV